MLKIITTTLLLTCLFSCTQERREPIHTNPQVNQPQSKLEQKIDRDNRKLWQKPDLVLSILGDLKGKTVADIGAGTGYFSFRLVRRAEKVIAIDIDTMMIKFIEALRSSLNEENQSKIETRLASSDHPNLQSQETDVILIVNTIAYISNRQSYIENLKSYLKPGGKIVIVDFKMKRLPIDAPITDYRIPLHIIEEDFYKLGFKNIETDDTSLEHQWIITASL